MATCEVISLGIITREPVQVGMKGWAMADGFIELYQRAANGDRRAQSDLWTEFRERMHCVIRQKANDLRLQWAVDPDDIYDLFFSELFNSNQFPTVANAGHFANYVAKSLRRTTKRRLQIWKCENDLRVDVCLDEVAATPIINELEQEEQLNRLYGKLSQRERDLCSLVKEGCGWREIGEELSLAEDTARMIYRRALCRIRKELLRGGVTQRR